MEILNGFIFQVYDPLLEMANSGISLKNEQQIKLVSTSSSSKETIIYDFGTLFLNEKQTVYCHITLVRKYEILRAELEINPNHECSISRALFYHPAYAGYPKFKFDEFEISPDNPHLHFCEKSVHDEPNIPDYMVLNLALKSPGFTPGFFGYTIKKNIGNSLLMTCLKTGDYHDLTIKLDNGYEFKVHKMVLAFQSQVFKKMIDSSIVKNKTGIIHVTDAEPDVMQEIINYMYGVPYDVSTSPRSIFRIAHMYLLNGLTERCEYFMKNNINDTNFVAMLELVSIEEYELKELKSNLESFIKKYESQVIRNNDYVEFLLRNMKTETIHVEFRLAMTYKLKATEKVLKLILNNLKDVLENPEFQKLISKHPKWSIELLKLCNHVEDK